MSSTSEFITCLGLSLLINLSVDGRLEGLDFFFLDKQFLSFMEATNLYFDDLNFFFFFLDFFFLGANDDFSDGDLLLNLFFLNGGLFQRLSCVSQFSSGRGLFGDNFLSLSSVSLNILFVGSDIGGVMVNLFLNFRFFGDSDNLERSLELFSLGDKSIDLSNFMLDLLFNLRDFFSCLLNSALQFSSLRGVSLNFRSDGSFSLFEVSFLLLDDSGKLLLRFLGSGVNLFTSILTFFFYLLDLSNDSLLGLLNLVNEVCDLLFNNSSLLLNNR